MNIQLIIGQNEVVYPGATMPVADAVASIATKINSIWYYDKVAGKWLGYSPTAPSWANDLATVTKGETYSVTALANCTWVIQTEQPKSDWWKIAVAVLILVGLIALAVLWGKHEK